MGYFSNGTEGDMYEKRYCNHCLHQDKGCAIWEAHMLHNDEECNNQDSILHELIPRDGIHNGECKMFLKSHNYIDLTDCPPDPDPYAPIKPPSASAER